MRRAVPPAAGAEFEVDSAALTKTASGLRYQDVKVGQRRRGASTGRSAVVHYTGWLTDGTKFDSSRDRGTPFSFPARGGAGDCRVGSGRGRHEGRGTT